MCCTQAKSSQRCLGNRSTTIKRARYEMRYFGSERAHHTCALRCAHLSPSYLIYQQQQKTKKREARQGFIDTRFILTGFSILMYLADNLPYAYIPHTNLVARCRSSSTSSPPAKSEYAASGCMRNGQPHVRVGRKRRTRGAKMPLRSGRRFVIAPPPT